MLSVGVSLIQFLSQFSGSLYLSVRLLHYLEQEVRVVQLLRVLLEIYLFKAIVGHNLYSGCLYDMPSWTLFS